MANYNLTQTGAEVQVILDRVAAGYIYMGTADLTTTPDTTNPNVCYLLKAVGTYTNFGNVTHSSGITIAKWDGTAWSYQNVPSSAIVAADAIPTENSTNPVQSGGVYNSLFMDVSEVGAIQSKASIMSNGSKFIAVSNTYYVYFFEAPYDCEVSLTFARADSYVHDGRICIVNSKNDIVVNTAVTELYQVANGTTYTHSYSLKKNQCLCVNARSADTMSVTMTKALVSGKVGELNQTASSLVGEINKLKDIDETYPDLTFVSGSVVFGSNGVISTASGYNVYKNIPVIPNSKITLTLTQVTSGGGRGFAFYRKDGVYISGVSAVAGTTTYEMTVPSNAFSLAITLWGSSTNTFDISVQTSTTNMYDSQYDRIAPALYCTEKLTNNSTYNSCVDELYIPRNLFEVVSNRNQHFSTQFYQQQISLAIYEGSSNKAIARPTETSIGNVLEFKVYSTNDSTNYPIGMLFGYAIINTIGADSGTYLRVLNIDYITTLKNSPQIAAFIASKNNDFSQNIKICLPDNITAIVGDTLQLFYRGFILTPLPDKYDILVSCTKGKQFPRYFEYTPTSADTGTTTFKIQVKNDNRGVIAEKSCTLTTKAKASSPSSNKNILCFGASTTQNGEWPHEADRRLTGSGGTPTADGLTNITFCGSMTASGTGYFGKGGWKWESYTTNNIKAYRFQVSGVNTLNIGSVYTNNGNSFTISEINVAEGTGNILCTVSSLTPAPTSSGTLTKSSGTGDSTITFTSVDQDAANPLWDNANNKMSFIPYANTYCNGQIDVVYVWLGYNGMSAGQTDFTSVMADVKTFADTLHTEFPSAKLKIMGESVPSFRGGMGANYGAVGYGFADGYGIKAASFNLSDAYQDFANQSAYSGFVEFVNVATQFDVEYNMQHTEKAVNTRNTSVTEWMDTNGVHPANAGYMQVADVVYRNIMKEFA